MTLDTTSLSQNWVHLVEVADVTLDGTPGQTWRIADRNIALSNGSYYEGRLLQVPPIRLSAGRLIEPRMVTPDITLVLDGSDDAVRTILDANYGLAGKVFTLKLGQGKTAGDYQVRFTGTVQFPGGIDWDERTVTVRLDNLLGRDSVVVPVNKFFASTYPTVEDKSEFLPIPVIYGDWRSTAGNGEQVPCFMIEDLGSQQYKFKIADHAIVEIEAVYRNGVDITAQTSSASLALAEFVWAAPGGNDYDPETDAITAHIYGKAVSTLATGRYDTPAAIAYDLITDYMGLTSGDLDLTAFGEWEWTTGPDDRMRRWIGRETATSTLLAELMDESFWELLLDADGDYTVKPRWSTSEADGTTFRKADLAVRGDGSRAFRILRDPERTYANQVVSNYRRKAGEWDGLALNTEASYGATTTGDDTDAQSNVGQTRRYRLQLNWIYKAGGATDRTQRHLLAYGNEVEMLEATVGPAGVTLYPGDQFRLIYSKYEITSTLGTPFMARAVEPNIETMLTQLMAWNLDNLQAKRYQADGSASYATATDYDKATGGFYSTTGSVFF